MKIGLVRRGYSPTGGAENYLRRLAEALSPAHEPVLISSPDWPRDQWPTTLELARIPDRGSPRVFATGVRAWTQRHQLDRLFSLERVWRCDCYRAGDGVHRAWLERRSNAEPWWRRTLRPFNAKHRQILDLEKSLFARDGARQIIANSELVKREISTHYGTPADRVTVVYNGLPTASFRSVSEDEHAHARNALALEPDDYVILFAGTGWERKGLTHVLRALVQLPASSRATLLVAGQGNPRRYLRRMSATARHRARFLGPMKDMRVCYAAADVFVAPTLYDPFSNACLEALAAGLPVLTTRANGFAEIIEPGVHGEVLDDPGDGTAAALAAALLTWSDPKKLGAAHPLCAARAAGFTIERNVRETLDILLAKV